MAARNDVALAGKLMMHAKRWESTPENRRDLMEMVVDAFQNDKVDVEVRLKAGELFLKMESMNQIDEKLFLMSDKGEEKEQKVILLLPSNGTEKR